ncbi:probable 3',5'-cyclic phosphodiesterase pde-5 [Caerostris darwini]|uniref:Probable 3',5'-cyclic phosphodiesterase pde-5 n=1 Tax=Caerostris darwini TaxID=1538125 RepID=A0AAV4QXT0_9ARAC|nr:probable 3',5'-cyclic phosphodiesterase pde-5 [Caerostris darwini]
MSFRVVFAWQVSKPSRLFTSPLWVQEKEQENMKALMIASLAHDVGHPGLNDAYLKKVRCTLATMYSDPLLEHHHFQTCLLILQDIRCNIFFDLESEDYKQVLDDIKLCILATNLQKYKSQCEKMRHIIETGIDFRKRQVRNSIKALMMMACDLCGSWKRWEEHKNIVWSLYKEYFNQGDKEVSFGIVTPAHMLRTNAESIPRYQTAFLLNVVTPIFELLSKVFPQLKEITKTTQDNLECWKTYK